MNLEKKKLIWESFFYLILIFVIIALVLIFVQMRKATTRCILDPKQYLIEHFEKVTGGNMSCTCMTDNPEAYTFKGRGFKILFSSEGYYSGKNQGLQLTP